MSLDTFLLAMAAPARAPSPLVQLLPLVAVLAIFYFIILLPMKRKQQKVQAFLAALKEGDQVVTSGGIYGTITRIKDEAVQLQIAENVASTSPARRSSATRGRSPSSRIS